MNKPLVSIIIVNFLNDSDTLDVLKDFSESSYSNIEIIIVDTGSPNAKEIAYTQLDDRVRYIHNPANLGYAAAHNLGIKASKGEYLFLINNDTRVESTLISKLIAQVRDSDFDAVSPIIKYHDEAHKIQYAGYTKLNPYTGRNKTILNPNNGNQKITETAYLHGAAIFCKRDAILKTGMISEDYFLYFEELDWSIALKKNGFKLGVVQNCDILHKVSSSTGKNSPLKTYYMNRNRLAFMRKNFSGISFNIFFLYFLFLPFLRELIKNSIKRDSVQIRALFKSLFDFMGGKLAKPQDLPAYR